MESNLFNAYMQKYFKEIDRVYSKEEQQKFYEQAEELLKNRYNEIFDSSSFLELMKKSGDIIVADFTERKEIITGDYFFDSNDIALAYETEKLDDSLLHEILHKNYFMRINKSKKDLLPKLGYLEGATEFLKSEAFQNKKDVARKVIIKSSKTKKDEEVMLNLKENTSYPAHVAIIKELRILEKCDFLNEETESANRNTTAIEDDILNGKENFDKGFKEKYGENIYNKIMNLLNKIETENESFFEIENIILDLFNKEFEKVRSKEEAKKYFERLSNLYKVRGHNRRRDDEFLEFVNSKLENAKEKFGEIEIPEFKFNIPEIEESFGQIVQKDNLQRSIRLGQKNFINMFEKGKLERYKESKDQKTQEIYEKSKKGAENKKNAKKFYNALLEKENERNLAEREEI